MNVEAKGRYQVQKRITHSEQLRVVFGLMPAFVFYVFCVGMFSFDSIFHRYSVRFGRRNVKKAAHGVTVSISEQVSTRGPKFEIAEFLPRSELVGECLPQTQQNERNDHFFSHGGVQKCGDLTIRPSAVT